MTDISCQELVELITSYLDDALDDETRGRFEAHLAVCDACAEYLDQFRETIRLLGEVQAESLSEHTSQRLVEAFHNWSREN